MKLIVVESGGSKSSWHIQNGNEYFSFQAVGLNPFELNKDKESQLNQSLKSLSQKKGFNIYFYGSGCENSKGKENILKIFESLGFSNSKIQVDTDLKGACIALLGNKNGTVGILGTGAITALYDNDKVVKTFSGLGALLGDEGSGFDIGKRLLKAYFYNKLPKKIETEIQNYFSGHENIIPTVYSSCGRKKVAGLSKIVVEYKSDQQIKALLCDAFTDFYKFSLKPISKNGTVSLLGSIAYYFDSEIKEVLSNHGYKVEKIIQSADKELFNYHKRKV